MNEAELEQYLNGLKNAARLHHLYSEADEVFFHYRFIEKLYIACTGAEDLTRTDKSFDARLGDAGIGIKTFTKKKLPGAVFEKVAEFNKDAKEFQGLNHKETAHEVSKKRNGRIDSDCREYGIDIEKSIYHCLVRTAGGAYFHEEPYSKINVTNIFLIGNKNKNIIDFGDGKSLYKFNKSKHTLFRQFDLREFKDNDLIQLTVDKEIFEKILSDPDIDTNKNTTQWFAPDFSALVSTNTKNASVNGEKHIILPLYSTKEKRNKTVAPRSGINQWNAEGRERKMGEAYIPVPSAIRKNYPGFFPGRDRSFRMKLPTGTIISAKICQADGKALMANPNTELLNWLYDLIDLNKDKIASRLTEGDPYTYQDLMRVGKDSVRVTKSNSNDYEYEIETTGLDSYEDFIDSNPDDPRSDRYDC